MSREKTKLLVATLDVSGLPVQGPAVNEKPKFTHVLLSNPCTAFLPLPDWEPRHGTHSSAASNTLIPSRRQSWDFPSYPFVSSSSCHMSAASRRQPRLLPPPLPLLLQPCFTKALTPPMPPLPRQQDYKSNYDEPCSHAAPSCSGSSLSRTNPPSTNQSASAQRAVAHIQVLWRRPCECAT